MIVLAFFIAFLVSGILTDEGIGNLMIPNVEGTSGEKLPLPARDESPVPSISNQSDSWIEKTYGEASSSPSTGSDGCSPQKESLEFLSEELRTFWTNEIIRAFKEGLDGVDPLGRIGKIPEKEIVDALGLDSPFFREKKRKKYVPICEKHHGQLTKKRIGPPSMPAFGGCSKSTKGPSKQPTEPPRARSH